MSDSALATPSNIKASKPTYRVNTDAPAWRIVAGNIAAGATAGAVVEAALYPLDTIKTRLQTATSGGGLRALWQSGGGKALYSGILGNLAGVVPASAIFMGVYEPVKTAVEHRVPEDRQFLGSLCGGVAAGLAASFVRVPTEVIKQRMQTGEFTGAIRAVQGIVRREGARGLFAGYGSFLLRDLPFDAIEFMAYEQLKKAYKASLKRGTTGRTELSAAETSVVGALAGAVTGLVTTPLDVIKTRLMTQGVSRKYDGIFDCARKIAKQEGAATFFKGWEPRVLWISIGGCVFFTALEEAKKLYAPKVQTSSA
ncbi:probable mitochondrial carrier protein PET8 [Coccomyxa sp. Obi]|nr:probable mitochondrial carrier protein PET8 [Coccomyxa sp. Obi]